MAGTQLRRADLRGISTDCNRPPYSPYKGKLPEADTFLRAGTQYAEPSGNIFVKGFRSKNFIQKMKKIKLGIANLREMVYTS